MVAPTRRTSTAAQRSVTIEDVARAAGVAKSTVSNVLNGSGRFGEAARARVLDMVDQLGYQPHQGARSMRSRKTMRLAYLMPPIQLEPANLIMMQFMQALLTAAARQRYRVLVVAQEADPSDDIRRLAADRSVDAFVVSDLQDDDPRVELLCELGAPFSCFGRTRPDQPQSWADIDNAAAEAEAVRHVVDRGYARPGFIGFETSSPWDLERENGFRAGLASRGIPGDGAGVLRVREDASARGEIRSFIAAAGPDALLTGSDRIAAIVYGVAPELNRQVGRDLAVTGFDGSVSTGLLYPTLTSVVLPVEDIARRVVGRVMRQVESGADTEPGEVIPTWLREGASTPARTGTAVD